MCSEYAVKVENLSKCYHIYDHPRDRLKQFILPRLYRSIGLTPRQYFREFWALRDVSFVVRKGETFGIVGSNGSGKSTLLQMICGTLNPSGGSVQTVGRVAALLELGSGFKPEFTGRENVYMNAALLGLRQDEINARFEKIAAFADIGDFLDQPVKRYSSGMYVRLAFAVIANVDADILLIDEALAVGDISFAQKCMRFLQEFKSRGALLFVSHNPNAVVSLCDNALWLDKGSLKALGSAKHVTESYLADRYSAPRQAAAAAPEKPSQFQSQDASGVTDGPSQISRPVFRTDLVVSGFNHKAHGFGHGGGIITNARFCDSDGRALAQVTAGQHVRFEVEASLQTSCHSLIIGFQFKNKLGQVLFACNTYLEDQVQRVSAEPGDQVKASFVFNMPLLPKGDYSVDVAIADGVPSDVKQLQWLHDAIIVQCHATSVTSGLVGLIFDEVKLNKI